MGLAFGSEIKAVLAAGGVDQSIDDQALSEYLWFGNTHGDRTFYRGVRSLMPGHWLIVEAGRARIEPWWRIEHWLEGDVPLSQADATVALRERIDGAVQRQLVADVPVGLFLSGGIDSSTVAASAMHVQKRPMQSFAAGFDFERGVNELPKAALVAHHLGLEHRELQVTAAELAQTLRFLAAVHDEPFADAANIPLYLMSRALEGRVKVVLLGDGGDELFAGYRRHALLLHARWARLWPRALSSSLGAAGSFGRRAARLLEAVSHPEPALRMASLLTVERLGDPPERLLVPDRARELAASTDAFLAYREAADRFARFDPVQQMLLTDLTVQLPSQFLPKVDRATMAAGVEARVPLLDERVVQLAVALPVAWKVGPRGNKLIVRDALRGRVPDAIVDGPKTGFGVPFEHWLAGPLFDFTRERILDAGNLRAFALDPAAVERTLSEHRSGRRDRGFRLWKLLQLALWREQRV
jgi:asparagine synthase (glutamine-hydrolysing)